MMPVRSTSFVSLVLSATSLWGCAAVLFVCLSRSSVAQESPKTSTVDNELDRLLGNSNTAQETIPPEQIPQAMRTAAEQLADKDLTKAIAKQQAIAQALSQLLDQTSSTRPQSSTPSQNQSSVEEQKASPHEQGQQTGGKNEGPAKESLAGAGSGTSSTAVQRHRRSLATSVWGHLPDRVREQLQRSYQEEYLPEYEQLIESYYKRLARQRNRSAPEKSRPETPTKPGNTKKPL